MKIKRKSSVGCSPSQNQAMTNVVQRRCRARRAASSSDGQLVISESGDLRDPLELFWISAEKFASPEQGFQITGGNQQERECGKRRQECE